MPILGRAGLDHPVLNEVPKEVVYAKIEAIYTNLSNDLSGRYFAIGPVSDSTMTSLEHGFGVASSELKIIVYTGAYPNLVRVPDFAVAGYTIVETVGDETTSIDVTAPAVGGPHTFAVWVVHGKGIETVTDLDDAVITSPIDGQYLVYDSGTSKWINQHPRWASESATIASNTITPTTSRPTKRITGAASDLQMLASPTADKVVVLINETGSDIQIKNDTGGTAANRFYTGTGLDLTFKPNAAVMAIYDATLLRWVLVGGSGGAGGLTPTAISTTTAAATNNMYLADSTAGSFTITLPGGTTAATVGVLDALETFVAFPVTVAPASGQSIDNYPADDTLVLDYARANVVFHRALGTTSWKMQLQATTTVPEASATVAGIVSTGTQVFGGDKSFNGTTTIGSSAQTQSHVINGSFTSSRSAGGSSAAWAFKNVGAGPASTRVELSAIGTTTATSVYHRFSRGVAGATTDWEVGVLGFASGAYEFSNSSGALVGAVGQDGTWTFGPAAGGVLQNLNGALRSHPTGATSLGSYGTAPWHEISTSNSNSYTLTVRSLNATPLAQTIFECKFQAAAPNNTTALFMDLRDNSAARFQMRSNGGLLNFQANDINFSDERIKTNIAPTSSQLAFIMGLEVKDFEYRDNPGRVVTGLIAQDVEELDATLVHDTCEKTVDEVTFMAKGVNTSDIYHRLIKAVQEQQVIIEDLTARIEALEA